MFKYDVRLISPMQLLDLKDSKEAVYGALDAWVAWEQNFPIASLKRVLITLEKEQQWHRVIQVRESSPSLPLSFSFSLHVRMSLCVYHLHHKIHTKEKTTIELLEHKKWCKNEKEESSSVVYRLFYWQIGVGKMKDLYKEMHGSVVF